ncbi:MAG TPA: DUF983 domain-containing protein [Caulobacteraceae bacterium]|jgi:uncharacterized protein (DUF983 family)
MRAMSENRTFLGLKRGARLRCPNCGEGKLFRAYLKVRETCEVCGHDNAQYPADDAPPYFTMLIVGHLIVAPLLLFPFIWEWPPFLVAGITLPLLAISCLLLLPVVKGAVVGVHWATGRTIRHKH